MNLTDQMDLVDLMALDRDAHCSDRSKEKKPGINRDAGLQGFERVSLRFSEV